MPAGTHQPLASQNPHLTCFSCDYVNLEAWSAQGSGYNPNYREVGGEDTAVVAAVGNTAANVTGMLVPFLGVALRKMSGGSWLPLFGYAALLNLATAAFFATSASVTPARTLLRKKD